MSEERHIITVDVVDIFNADTEDGVLKLVHAISKLQTALKEIPEEHQDNAVLRLQAFGEYASAILSVEYVRPETDAEMAEHQRRQQVSEAREEERERATYNRLRQKYGEITHD